jgi:phage tail-like protein
MSHITGQWTIPGFHYRVTIDGAQLSFKNCSGLESENKVIEYRHSDSVNFYPEKQLGLRSFSNLTLEKAVFAADSAVTDIFNRIWDYSYMSEEGDRFEVLVELLDEHAETVMSWNLVNCIPTKLKMSAFGSDKNESAVETMELAYESVRVEW